MMRSEQLKRNLRYMGRQYSSGRLAEGAEDHYLVQAADRIDALEEVLNNLLNDCINFDGNKLTGIFMKEASDILKL